MKISIPDIPGTTTAFTVEFPVQPRQKFEWKCNHQARFSDACFALELNGWKEVRFSQRDKPWLPSSPVCPLLFMRPDWEEPQIKPTADVYRGEVALYWKYTGIAKELLG